MAQLSLGEGKWRMLRRGLGTGKRFRFTDCRNGTRHDKDHFDWLLVQGFFVDAGDGWYEVTEKGRGSADLGMYAYEPSRVEPMAAKRRKTK
jgi:hypothetical protein